MEAFNASIVLGTPLTTIPGHIFKTAPVSFEFTYLEKTVVFGIHIFGVKLLSLEFTYLEESVGVEDHGRVGEQVLMPDPALEPGQGLGRRWVRVRQP